MAFPLTPPVAPMLAKAVKTIPEGDFAYEPKWDGFRCIVYRDGRDVELGSRSGKPLTRYFPEVAEAIASSGLPGRCVLDGEIVVPVGGRLDFDHLTNRIHPAQSRVDMLAHETPASFVGFDLLALGDDSLLDRPFSVRREALEAAFTGVGAPLHLTTCTRDLATATDWFDRFEGAGLDGVVAKPVDAAYDPGRRTMLKIKHHRTADVVIAGYRLHKASTPENRLLGSMLLGLYDDAGVLQFVGGCSAFPSATRADLPTVLDELRVELDDHPWGPHGGEDDRRPEARSRWSGAKDMSFVPLAPSLVAEVAYDQLQSGRFRHATQFQRFRPDREPVSCTYSQLDEPAAYDLQDVLE